MRKVTDPKILAQLESDLDSNPKRLKKVTDPSILAQLEGSDSSATGPFPLNLISKTINQTPLGMAAKGATAALEGINKVMTPLISVGENVRKAVSPIFQGSRALGVGTAKNMAEGPQNVTSSVLRAYQPGYQPRGPVESIGAKIGEAAPVVAAAAVSPNVAGPIAFMGQQAYETGKISPVPALFPLAKVAKPLLRSAGAKTLSYIGDVPEESILYKADHPEAVKTAKDIAEIASSDVPRIANKYDQVISGLKNEANKTLSTSRYLNEGAFSKDEVIGSLAKARENIGGVYTPEAESASRVISKISNQLKKIRNTVSQNQVSNLINDLDREIPWEKVWKKPADLTLTDKVLIDARTRLDGILKSRNSQYANAMKPLSEAIQARNEYLKTLKLEKVRGEGYQPSDTTSRKLFGINREERLGTQRTLGKTKEFLGEDLQPQVKASQVRSDFEPETGRSFRGEGIGIRQIFGRPLAKNLTGILRPSPVPSLLTNTSTQVGRIAKKITPQKAKEYLQRAGGNKDKAREMALRDGWRLK